jgi:methionyl-tRNA formyltransferase
VIAVFRGVVPWPGAYTTYRRKMLKIFKSQVLPVFPGQKPLNGQIIRADKNGIVVAAAKGFLEIKEVQLESGRRMTAQSFIIGHKLAAGEVLGKK